jgi:hypothetical protein
MNRHLSDLPGEGEQRDPVADFFARERADIRDLPAGADRWESIVVEARRPVRRSWLPYLAGAAAVVVAAGVVWGNGRGPGTEQAADPASSTPSVSTVTVTATDSTTPTQPSETGATSSHSTPTATTFPVPTSFDLVSMTNAGGKHLFALGRASCPKGQCTAVIGSDDDGVSWTTRASFTTLTSPGPRATPDRADQVVGIRFADPQVGYVYGSTTMRTLDGGRSWTPLDVDGRTVLSLEIGGGTTWMVTAAKCARSDTSGARGCTDLDVRSIAGSAATPTRNETLELPQPAESSWLSMDGADAYVSVAYLDQDTHTLPRRVSGKPVDLARPEGCPDAGGVWLWGTANRKGGLVAVCQLHDAKASYGVATSTDRGATWSMHIAPALGATQPAGVWLTAVDLDRLVAVPRGLSTSARKASTATTLVTSGDGGSTWVRPKAAPSGPVDWVGAAGGTLVYAVTGGRSYWVSHDSGATFEQVALRR